MSQNPARNESATIHITHATTYATLALVAQSLVTVALPYLGLRLPAVVIAAIVSVLVGGGTVVLHMAGLAVPGAPVDNGRSQMQEALRTLLREEGPTLLAYLTHEPAPTVPPSAPPGPLPLAAAPPPAADQGWAGPPVRPPLGAGHAPPPPPS